MTQDGNDRALAAAAVLTGALQGLSDRLDVVNEDSKRRDATQARYGHVNRLLVVIDIFLTVISVTATVIALNALSHASAASARAASNQVLIKAIHRNSIYACQLGNQSRAQQIQLWEHLIAIGKPPPHETKAQAAARHQLTVRFLAYIKRDFAPRDCSRIYRLGSH